MQGASVAYWASGLILRCLSACAIQCGSVPPCVFQMQTCLQRLLTTQGCVMQHRPWYTAAPLCTLLLILMRLSASGQAVRLVKVIMCGVGFQVPGLVASCDSQLPRPNPDRTVSSWLTQHGSFRSKRGPLCVTLTSRKVWCSRQPGSQHNLLHRLAAQSLFWACSNSKFAGPKILIT